MITKEFASSRGSIHYHSLNYTDQATSEELDADKYLVNISITLYTLLNQLDKFINSHWICINEYKIDNAYKSRQKYLPLFDARKSYQENFKLEELKLYERYSLQLGNIFESNWA